MPFPLVTPSTMMLVALPRIFGAITSSVTLATASSSTNATPKPSGRSRAASRRVEFLKSFERSSGMPAAPHRPLHATAADVLGRLHRLVLVRTGRLSVVVAHAASSSVSCDATISA